MSREIVALLDAFDALPDEEKRVFAAELFRRAPTFDSSPLEEDDTADEMVAHMDA